jgi:RNA polymerase sigma-70 factor (ECF subfamily)
MSQELIQACLYGDPSARKQLIEQQYSSFMAMARRYAKSNAQADVFFDTAFVHVFQMLPEFKDSGLGFDAWMKETFLASVIQQLKNNKAEYYVTTTTRVVDESKKASNDLFGQGAEENVNDLSAEEYIRALQQLPASFRTVYNMRVIDQYSFSTISQMMEVSESSAQNTLERARNQFAKNLQMFMHGYA